MLTFLWVGRTRDRHLRGAQEDYLERIRRHERRVDVVEVPPPRGRLSAAERADREGAALVAALPGRGLAVALDQGGRSMSSDDLARKVLERRGEGLSFVVGGEEGQADAVLQACGLTLSLGPLTLPHELARVVLLEQVYRGLSILAGSPYHRPGRAGRPRP